MNHFFIDQAKVTSKAWAELEHFTGEKYPPCLKKWLVHAGYNKLVALGELSEKEIAKLEDHIDKNRFLVTNSKCCYSDTYKSQAKFAFLPGHKATLLGIAHQIQRMREHTPVNLSVKPKATKAKVMKIRSDAQIKSMLIDSLNAYSIKLGVKLPVGIISEKNVINFTKENQMEGEKEGSKSYKCAFSCPFCAKVIPTAYKTYWRSSNVTKHIKHHIDEFNDATGKLRIEDIEHV